MAIPDYEKLIHPVLSLLDDGKDHPMAELRSALALQFQLSDAELSTLLPSGKATVWASRVGWAKTYLTKAGLATTVKRGVYRVTETGRKALAEPGVRIDNEYLSRFPQFRSWFNGPGDESGSLPVPVGAVTPAPGNDVHGTPEEVMDTSFRRIKNGLEQELLERVLLVTPSFFERLVVDLLVRMGYGGSTEEAGQAVGRSGDEGIDGIIKEDRLGLDRIYIQAKRWDPGRQVGRPEVQAFAGSMEGKRARKGIFITTTTFTRQAEEYVQNIEKKIILIDGPTLAAYMVETNLGVTEVQTYTVKRLDGDYFESVE